MTEVVVHPKHYNSHPSGLECMDVVELLPFCPGNAVKYLWRAGLKTKDRSEDIRKAMFYLDRILQHESRAMFAVGPNPLLERYGNRVMHHGGWAAGPIWHILLGCVTSNRMHIATALNCLHAIHNHPQEKRDVPQPRLQA